MNIIYFRVSLYLHKFRGTKLVMLANHIVRSMTGNARFTAPTPALTVINLKAIALQAAIEAAMSGDRTLIALRNTLEEELRNLLRQIAAYVDNVANGDGDLILSSGFQKTRPITPTQPTTTPQDIKLRSMLPGIFKGSCKKVHEARSYEIQVCTTEPGVEANWHTAATTFGCRFELTGIEAGTFYYVRMRAINKLGASEWSEIATEWGR